jgi:hypothetical protein
MKNLRKVSQMNFQIKLKGFGLSIIDKKKEILYISTFGFLINFIQFSYPGQDLNEKKNTTNNQHVNEKLSNRLLLR